MHPWVPCKESTGVGPQVTGFIRLSLHNGFTAYFALSPVIGLFATVALRIVARCNPVGRKTSPQNLTPASRRQDHTTSPSAKAPFVCAPTDCSRQAALHHVMRAGAAAATASRPAFVTIAIAPPWDETARLMK
jgi:hypothetical protein